MMNCAQLELGIGMTHVTMYTPDLCENEWNSELIEYGMLDRIDPSFFVTTPVGARITVSTCGGAEWDTVL